MTQRSNEMTREESNKYIRSYSNGLWGMVRMEHIDKVLDQIFNDHEAQLKAKESDLERQDMIIKCLNIDLDNKEKLLKAKEKKMISKDDADNLLYESKENLVDSLCTQSELIDDLYSQLKQRDEEIERLKAGIKQWKKNFLEA